ncbi:MAG: hypothetical protein Q4E74_11940, partial [Ruminococcus sp.]|nr:hypothetical protein [Ruminococcus sp.]
MNKKIIALVSILTLAISMTGCGNVSETNDSNSSIVQSSETSETKKETTEPAPNMLKVEPVPVPEGGWTEETISEVIYVNGYNIKLPCDFEELSNKINIVTDKDHLYFFQNGQGASTEIEYNGTEVGSVLIDDFSDKENFNLGKIYAILCNS